MNSISTTILKVHSSFTILTHCLSFENYRRQWERKIIYVRNKNQMITIISLPVTLKIDVVRMTWKTLMKSLRVIAKNRELLQNENVLKQSTFFAIMKGKDFLKIFSLIRKCFCSPSSSKKKTII